MTIGSNYSRVLLAKYLVLQEIYRQKTFTLFACSAETKQESRASYSSNRFKMGEVEAMAANASAKPTKCTVTLLTDLLLAPLT
jgi:hypothetical protein